MIQAALRASIEDEAVRVGPFRVLFTGGSSNPFCNYAIPDDGAEPTEAELAELIAAFRARDRVPRFEFVVPNPPVEAALAAAGFSVADRLVLMAVDEAGFTPPDPVPAVAVRVADDNDAMWYALRIQHVAYGEEGGVRQSDVDGAVRSAADGQSCCSPRSTARPRVRACTPCRSSA